MSMSFNEDPVMGSVKRSLMSRGGPNALKSAVRFFRAMDQNDDGELTPTEFTDGLKRLGVELTPNNAAYLMRAMDRNNDGLISVNEFVRCMVGGMNPRRKKLVDRAFDKFDKTDDGKINVDDLKGTFDATQNPLVLRGEKTEKEIMGEFLSGFDSEINPDGVITKDEFDAYYSGLSASIQHDDYFEAMILKAWKLDEPTRPRLDTTERIWGSGGDPLAINDPLLATDALSKTLGTNGKTYNFDHMKRQPLPYTPNPSVKPDYISTSKRDYPAYNGAEIMASDPTYKKKEVFSPTGNPIIDAVRKKILDRSDGEGFKGIRRSFRIIDKDKNSSLDKSELEIGMKRYRVPLTPLEAETVMTHCDRDGSGLISVTEFLRCVRGPMTQPSRVNIIRIAYDRLDTDKSGVVSLKELSVKYDVTKHPKVINGQKTKTEVMREFVEDWDKSGDDKITWEEWMDYYSDLSCGIDDDQYFELMIRNAWHISGGEGAAANTTCRRVLATFEDGTQKVLEIKDDIGLRSDDIEGMKKRLAAQGHKNIKKVALTGAA